MMLPIFSHNPAVLPKLNRGLLIPERPLSFLLIAHRIAKFTQISRLNDFLARKLLGYVSKSFQKLERGLGDGNPPIIAPLVSDPEQSLIWEMIQAIDQEDFVLHYQPQIDLNTGHLLGVEALLRWPHPRLGQVSPAEFIPIAERTGLIVPLGYWVLKQSCLQYRQWRASGIPPFKLSVNLSQRQLQEEDLLTQIETILRSTQMNPIELALEVTESLMFQEPKKAIIRLNSLKKLGIQIAIDDFGVGYSSLSYLKDLPIHTLKIDKSFLDDLLIVGKNQVILQSIIELGHRLTLKIIAEGIESQEQLNILKQMKCDYGQGYLFSRPLGLPEITRYFQQDGCFHPCF